MKISFISKVNNLTTEGDNIYFKEDEELNYNISVKPSGNHFELRLDHNVAATDRYFLSLVYELREVATTDNTIQFDVYFDGNKVGKFWFYLPPQLSYPVSFAGLSLNKFADMPTDVNIIFKRLNSFIIKLATEVELSLG